MDFPGLRPPPLSEKPVGISRFTATGARPDLWSYNQAHGCILYSRVSERIGWRAPASFIVMMPVTIMCCSHGLGSGSIPRPTQSLKIDVIFWSAVVASMLTLRPLVATLLLTALLAATAWLTIVVSATVASLLILTTPLVAIAALLVLVATVVSAALVAAIALVVVALAVVLIFAQIPTVHMVASLRILFRKEAALFLLPDVEHGAALRIFALQVEVFVVTLLAMHGSDVEASALGAGGRKLGEDGGLDEKIQSILGADLYDKRSEFE